MDGSSVTTLTYDIENRVIGISYPGGATNSFAYNGEDLRTQKVDSTGTQNYVCDGASPASAVLKDGNAVYTPGLSERRGTTSKFTHGDALGSTRGITDSTQAVTDSQLYDAFGNTVSSTGTTPTPFGFVGKEQYQTDGDSGLQLLGHRYYDPSIGRFLSQDPIQDGTNWYAYCYNNPVKSLDPTGLDAPPDGFYKTPLDAAIAMAQQNQPLSDAGDREWGGWIVKVGDFYQPIYRQRGTGRTFQPGFKPVGAVGTWHTHPGFVGPPTTDPMDQNVADFWGIPGYASQSDGWIVINDPRPSHSGDMPPGEGVGHTPILVGKPYPNDDLPNIRKGETIGRTGLWKLPPALLAGLIQILGAR